MAKLALFVTIGDYDRQKHLTLRSTAQRCVSKGGQQRDCGPPFETRTACAPQGEVCQNPKLLSPGWSSGLRPSGQWYLRSASAIGCSLMLAMRRCIRPLPSNSQFSLP
jgi:hypothetical protein